MRSMRSYQLHEFEYEMLADHIGGPECHEVWRLQASPGVTVATWVSLSTELSLPNTLISNCSQKGCTQEKKW